MLKNMPIRRPILDGVGLLRVNKRLARGTDDPVRESLALAP